MTLPAGTWAARIDFPANGGRLALAFADPAVVLQAHRLEDVAGTIAEAEAEARAGRWVLGFVAYEAAPAFDAALPTLPPATGGPLACFAAYDRPGAADDEGDAAFRCGLWRPEIDRARFDADVATIREDIGEGRYYQCNLTTRLAAPFAGSAPALYAALRAAQPDGYCLYLDGGPWQVLSVSPELFFDFQPDARLLTRPMKGTAPRHADPAQDAAAAAALAASEKERAENLMIVDLLRNDLSRVAETGSVRVPRLFHVAALPTAWQMTSDIACRPRPGTDLGEVFRALFPCGSVTGAPKRAAMAAIAARERSPRGIYCGALGVIRPGGHATFNVAIRTVTVAGGEARCGIGSGITWDSEAAAEFAEWQVKRRFLLRATADFQLIETLRLEDGGYWLLDGHLRRLAASAEHFGFPVAEADVRAALAAVAAAHAAGPWRVRLLADRAGGLATEAFPLESLATPLPVALAATPIAGDGEFLAHKTTERSAFAPHAAPAGCFDTLLWNRRGELTEFTRGNVVLELAGRRLTPPLACGLLPGVFREELLARGEVAEEVLKIEDLRRATRLWFINSVRGWLEASLAAAESHQSSS